TVHSSNPAEVGLRSKTWDYWDIVMQEIYSLQPATVKLGEKFTNFYAGPLNYAVTDPSKILKFGYYYSGQTDYMINTLVSTTHVYEEGYLEQQNNIVNDLLQHVEGLAEITAFNPTFFGEEKILKMKNGQLVQNLDVRDIIYGDYHYQNYELDVNAVNEAMQENTNKMLDFEYDNTLFSRVFIPIQAEEPYVISFVFNKHTMLKKTYEQLLDHIVISVVLFIATIIITNYVCRLFVAPVLSIKEKVKQIANQNFSFPLNIKSKDELGALASHVNEMGQRLDK